MNSLFTQDDVRDILKRMAHEAGHDAASVRLVPDYCTGELEFMITDSRGTIFSGSIQSEWRELALYDFIAKLREKYAQAFKPLDKMTPPESEIFVTLDDKDLLRVYRGQTADQTFDAGEGHTVRIVVLWSKK